MSTPEVIEAEILTAPAGAIVPVRSEGGLPARPWVKNVEFIPHETMVVDIYPDAATKIPATPQMVRELLCAHIPIKDAIRFLSLCRSACINPFGGEVFITTRENDRGGRDYQFVIAAQAFRRLAAQHRDFNGMTYEEFPCPDDKYVPVVKGVCKIWRKGAPEPYVQVVYLEEAQAEVGKGGTRSSKKGWANVQPREFLRKVTEARACRHAFPDQFSGFYSDAEFGG